MAPQTLPVDLTPHNAVMLYDGLCAFCDATVRWLLQHDHAGRIFFAPQQSSFAQTVFTRHHLQAGAGNTVYLLIHPGTNEEKILQRGDAILHALTLLGGTWKCIAILLRLLPRTLRDAVYTTIAHNRHRIAGKLTECRLPTSAERSRFIGL